MPKESLNIYLTVKDGASPVLSRIGDTTEALTKETQELAQTYEALKKANDPLIKRQAELEKKLKAAKEEAKEAEKAFQKLGDTASGEAFEKAKEKQHELYQELNKTKSAIQENERAYKSNLETIRKGAEGSPTMSSIAQGLVAGQVGEMAADSIGDFLQFGLSSGIGMPHAALASNTLSGAISGAAMGSIIPGIGTAIGGVVGAGSGFLSGATQILEEKDDSFKDYYGGLYDTVSSKTDETVEQGSTIAGSREQTRKAFVQRFGDEEDADEYLGRVKTMAAGTNYDYDEIVGYSKLLLNSYAPEDVFGVLQSLSDATAGLSLSGSDVEMMINGLSRMRTTGKATGEYLNYFSERGVDVYQALADATGADKKDIAGMVTKGNISGETAAQAILDFIDKEYGGLSEDLMGTYDAMSANLEDIMANLAASAGEGYNEVRKSGLEADQTAYTGALGEAIEELNRISGENRAYLENLSGQYQREALSAVMLGEQTTVFSQADQEKLDALRQQYAEAKESYEAGNQQAGLLMESYRESAEAIATAAYESSEQYLALKDTEMEQIEAIRENTAGLAAATLAYRESQERSKGAASGFFEQLHSNFVTINGLGNGFSKKLEDSPSTLSRPALSGANTQEQVLSLLNGPIAPGHAYGLERVPYDDYPALLHEGERVLTASEAREEDQEERPTSLLDREAHFETLRERLEREQLPADQEPPTSLQNREAHFETFRERLERETLSGATGEDVPNLGTSERPFQSMDGQGPALILSRDREQEAGYPKLMIQMAQIERSAPSSGGTAVSPVQNSTSPSEKNLTIQVTVTGNSFTAAGEELADQVAAVIVEKLEEAAMLAIPK